MTPFRVAVMMYHDIAESPHDIPAAHRPYAVSVNAFREQIGVLRHAGALLCLNEVTHGREVTPAPGGTKIILTFDDGHESNYSIALPLMIEANVHGTFFITAGWVGTAPYLNWTQVRALDAAGMEIGSHSMTHRPPAMLSPKDLRAEMRDSKRLLEDRLGRPVVSASSPTGFFNPALGPIAREEGYQALCCGRIGIWKDPAERFPIPRLPVKNSTSLRTVYKMGAGDPVTIGLLRGGQILRDALKTGLGPRRYLHLRRRLLRWKRSRE
jgi:peptidoglycan/xylan/chitin deacetylase (PgdA/CDA1 family)